MSYLDKFAALARRHAELSHLLGQARVLNDSALYANLSREFAELEPLVAAYSHYTGLQTEQANVRQMLDEAGEDHELRQLAREELTRLENELRDQEKGLQLLLLPVDPNDDRSVILEIRAGTGGEEAALFAADLFRMYSRFAETKGWKVEVLSTSQTQLGGVKEIIAMVSGKGAFSAFKFESGVHRVQRVPVTEAGGRIHTSACTVAVLPEADEVEVKIDEKDLRIDVYRSSGPGGQSVNTTDSAVRITHIPSGLVVICQDEKSQHKNKAKAMKVLTARLYDQQSSAAHEQRSAERRDQVGSGDRSERIRTYNFPQGRVTDHRIQLTLHQLEQVLAGGLGEIVDALRSNHQAEQLAALKEEFA